MAQVFYQRCDPAWVLGIDKWPPVETKSNPPVPKPDDRNPSPIELKLSFCGERCQENIREALIKLDGVDSVKLDLDSEKVTIAGKVKQEDARKEAKKVVRRSEFWPKKEEEEKKIDRLPKKGNRADNVQVVWEHGPVRLEVDSLKRLASPAPEQPVSAPQTTSESNHPGPFVHSRATPNRGSLSSPAPSPSALSPAALHPYARSASIQSDGDTPYLPSPYNPSQASSHPIVEMAQSQYDDGIHSNVQATVGQLHPVCNESAISAPGTSCVDDLIRNVENRREHGYFLSSEWLCGLEQKQRESLMAIFSRARYLETYHTGKTTLFERMENDVQSVIDGNNPLSVVTNEVTKNSFCSIDGKLSEASEKGDCVDSLYIADRSGIAVYGTLERCLGTSGNVSTAGETGETLTVESSRQITDPLPASPTLKDGLINMLLEEEGPKLDSTRTCIKQLLGVTCRSSSENSTSTGPLASSQNLCQRSRRLLCGDSFATLPTHGKGHILPTKVDKVIPMIAFDFRGTCEYLEVPISLKVSIETTVSCCLRNDENCKRMRVKYLAIRGEVKHVQTTEPNVKALVLKSIRTNVVACVGRSDRSDSHESINLDLEEEYSQLPRRRVLEKFPVSETGDQTKRLDRVWLALSGIKPESDELGSITVELQCHVGRTCKAQLQGAINGTHVLLFKDPRPVILEGDIYSLLDQKSFFELDVRYQLEFSYMEPCKPFPQHPRPYLLGERKTVVVDFDCILEYQARNLLLC